MENEKVIIKEGTVFDVIADNYTIFGKDVTRLEPSLYKTVTVTDDVLEDGYNVYIEIDDYQFDSTIQKRVVVGKKNSIVPLDQFLLCFKESGK